MSADSSLVGRDRELAELVSMLSARDGARRELILVCGPTGSGKTVLVEEAMAESGRRGMTIRPEAGEPYSLILGLLRECRRVAPEAFGLNGELEARVAAARRGGADSADAEEAVEAIGDSLARAVVAPPLAIFVDDLHLGDPESLSALSAIVRRLAGGCATLVCAYSPDALPGDHPVRQLRREWQKSRRLKEIQLAPLNRAHSDALIRRLLGAEPGPGLAERVHRAAQGSPLLIVELVEALERDGLLRRNGETCEIAENAELPIPESVREAVRAKWSALSPGGRAMAECAAVIGEDFEIERATMLAGCEEGIEELLEKKWIRECGPGRAAFIGGLAHEAIRADMPWSRRRDLNRRIAERLSASGAAPELAAERWIAAGDLTRGREALREAVETACLAKNYADAAQLARRALTFWPAGEDEAERFSLLERFAHCAQIGGRLQDAVDALSAAGASAFIRDNPAAQGRIHRQLAMLYGLLGKPSIQLSAYREAMEAHDRAGMGAEAAFDAYAIGEMLILAVRLSEARQALHLSAELGRQAGRPDLEARALGLEGWVLALRGDYEEGMNTARRGLDLAVKEDLPGVAVEVWRRMGNVRQYASDLLRAEDMFAEVVRECDAVGNQALAYDCMRCMSWVVFRLGDWQRATRMGREIVGQENGDAVSQATGHFILGIIQALRGETRAARRDLGKALEFSQTLDSRLHQLCIEWGMAVIEERENEPAAEERYRQLVTLWRKTEDRHEAVVGLCWAASFFAARGLETDLAACAEALSRCAADTANPEALAGLAYALGETALMQGRADEASGQFRQAYEHWEKMRTPLETARAQRRLGAALILSGRRKEGLEQLVQAYRLARKLGARPLASSIAVEIEAHDGRVEERGRAAAESRVLTRRQREIAQLIASGLTNKEMASRMYLSPRTVEMHVARLLDRLDCRTRAEAVQKARDLGALD